MRWSLLQDLQGRSGAENMGIDAALLRAAGDGRAVFRLYRWAPACLSFGRHEPATRRYDRACIERLGLETVRRPTGGRAVWHEHEVTYAVVGPATLFGSLRESYVAIHRMIAAALAALGVETGLAGDQPVLRPGAGACFAAPVGGEVVVAGRKLVGSAQVRERSVFLQHGSILLADGQDVVQRVTRGAALPPVATSVTAGAGRAVAPEEVFDALVTTAREAWNGTWTTVAGAPAPDPRYADAAWTWRR